MIGALSPQFLGVSPIGDTPGGFGKQWFTVSQVGEERFELSTS